MKRVLSALVVTSCLLVPFLRAGEIEIGKVSWQRDYAQGLNQSKDTGKPVLLFFQEVPGCAGCQKFGREVMSHPQIVEAIETEFVPILVHNNRPGEDAALLKKFGEPAWNYQVLRFLDASGTDVIPRRDGIWTVESVAARLALALEAVNRPVPEYLRALGGRESAAAGLSSAVFAMSCFWTGERVLGGVDGVLETEAGFLEGREVTKVLFDSRVVSFEKLLSAAAAGGCAQKVYTGTSADSAQVKRAGLPDGPLTDAYRIAPRSDQKRQIPGTVFSQLDLSPVQLTKVNAFARSEPENALKWLSPRQREVLEVP